MDIKKSFSKLLKREGSTPEGDIVPVTPTTPTTPTAQIPKKGLPAIYWVLIFLVVASGTVAILWLFAKVINSTKPLDLLIGSLVTILFAILIVAIVARREKARREKREGPSATGKTEVKESKTPSKPWPTWLKVTVSILLLMLLMQFLLPFAARNGWLSFLGLPQPKPAGQAQTLGLVPPPLCLDAMGEEVNNLNPPPGNSTVAVDLAQGCLSRWLALPPQWSGLYYRAELKPGEQGFWIQFANTRAAVFVPVGRRVDFIYSRSIFRLAGKGAVYFSERQMVPGEQVPKDAVRP
jgi:hypothetical protein